MYHSSESAGSLFNRYMGWGGFKNISFQIFNFHMYFTKIVLSENLTVVQTSCWLSFYNAYFMTIPLLPYKKRHNSLPSQIVLYAHVARLWRELQDITCEGMSGHSHLCFFQQTFRNCLLCARHCPRNQKSAKQSVVLTFLKEKANYYKRHIC